MRKLTRLSRRHFGRGLGASLALTVYSRSLSAQDAPRKIEIRISRFSFVPDHVEIRAGDTLVWVNDDLAPHTATARDDAWSTDTLVSGAAGQIVFTTPGNFDYFCAFHPHMAGTVSVLS